MFLFRKKEMDIAAAKQFWKWFVENEQWIIDNVSSCLLYTSDAADEL